MRHLGHHLHSRVLPLFLGAIALEVAWYLLVRRRSYPWREMLASVGVFLLRIPEKLLKPLVVLPLAYLAWSHRIITIPLNTAWGWAALFFGVEIAYYWMHRCSHEVRWLWASHLVHHTPEQIHLASAFRLGATELLSGNWLFYFPLYLLGLNPVAVGAMLGINLFYQFWLHTDIVGRLGPLEWILNTPAHHRVHHASNGEYLDRNYGGILIIWDSLFGTFAQQRPEAPVVYGLVHSLGTLNPITIAFREWLVIARDFWRARSWRERLAQLFGRPGDSLAAMAASRARRTACRSSAPHAVIQARAAVRTAPPRVIAASNAAEILQSIDEHRPHLIITDCAMPGMIGVQLCRTLREPHETRDIPLILHSGKDIREEDSYLFDGES